MNIEEVEQPDGWVTSTLGEVAQLVKDKVDPAAVADAHYVGLEHVESHTMRILGNGWGRDVKSAKTRFLAGDVLYGKLRPYLNKVAQPDFDGICSTDFLVFRESNQIDAGYFAQFLNQLWVAERANHLSAGVELPRVDWKGLSSFPISYPPSKQSQRAIVRSIDDARMSVGSSLGHLANSIRAVERFRQAVLAAACSGRLTADWRETHEEVESAEQLAALIARDRMKRLGRRFKEAVPPEVEASIPATWTWTTVGALVDIATGATPLRKRNDYYNGTIPWVTSGAVNAGLITEAREYISEIAIKETNAKVFPSGTLLVAMYGEGQTRGRVAELGIPAATNQAVAALLFDDTNEFLRPYLRVFFLENYERIRQLSFGGVQPNLSLGVIRDTVLPLPPHEEQAEIVRRIAQLTTVMNVVEGRIAICARRVEHSSQAILSKAFRGELTGTGK